MADERPKARSNLFTVWRNREAELGKRITYRDAAAATGLAEAGARDAVLPTAHE